MSKIKALNEPKINEKPREEHCNIELQETLAENEYKRAIRLKANGEYDIALSLLSELLETKVLNDIPNDDKSKKLWSIRFNCFKNCGFIYEEQLKNEQKALENYVIALRIDRSDVYLSQRCAQLALKLGITELAESYFENCLQYNPSHWIAADGLLKTLCKENNIMGAYFQAFKLYSKNRKNKYALRVLQEIAIKFNHLYKIYNELYNAEEAKKLEVPLDGFDGKAESVFDFEPKQIEVEEQKIVNLMEFQLKTLNWETIGKYIVDVEKCIKVNKLCPFVMIKYEQLYLEPTPTEDGNDMAFENWNRPRKKKRVRDVELLQQWHWWPKNKNGKNLRMVPPDDDSIFLKYYIQEECKVCKALKKSSNDFDSQTKEKFDNFATILKTTTFDLVRLNELWLHYISTLWAIPIPSELLHLFGEAYDLFSARYNISSFNPFSNFQELKNSLDIYLLYLELEMDKIEGNNKPSDDWVNLFHFVKLHLQLTGVQLGKDLLTYQLRLLNMEYLWCMHTNAITECLASIVAFQDALKSEPDDFVLHLPNGHCIDKEELADIKEGIEEELKEQEEKQKSVN